MGMSVIWDPTVKEDDKEELAKEIFNIGCSILQRRKMTGEITYHDDDDDTTRTVTKMSPKILRTAAKGVA